MRSGSVPLLLLFTCTKSKRVPCGPADCAEVQCSGLLSLNLTRYSLRLANSHDSVDVFCDATSNGGGWTVFQKRVNGSVSFSRTWDAYKKGFGNNAEFWLGNEYIHRLTRGENMVLRIEILNERTHQYNYAYYDGFSMGDEASGYKLVLGSYLTNKSNAGDSLSSQRNVSFSTCHRANVSKQAMCSVKCDGGWWYDGCNASAGLNGPWPAGVHWLHGHNNGSLSQGRIGRCTMQFRSELYFAKNRCPLKCANGGSCHPTGTLGDYVCECAQGYTGWLCTEKPKRQEQDNTFIIIITLTLILEVGLCYGVCMSTLLPSQSIDSEVDEQEQQLFESCESWNQFVRTRQPSVTSRTDSYTHFNEDSNSLRSWQLVLNETTPLRLCSAYRTLPLQNRSTEQPASTLVEMTNPTTNGGSYDDNSHQMATHAVLEKPAELDQGYGT